MEALLNVVWKSSAERSRSAGEAANDATGSGATHHREQRANDQCFPDTWNCQGEKCADDAANLRPADGILFNRQVAALRMVSNEDRYFRTEACSAKSCQ